MRRKSILGAILVIAALVPHPAEAQVEKPGPNSVAVGADVGFLASDNGAASDGALTLQTATGHVGAFVEYYYSARVSLRGMYGWATPRFESIPGRSLARHQLNVNVIYNWDIGRFRPFATVGGGTYFVSRREDGARLGRRIAKPGGNVGWGGEYYFRTFALKSEMNVHILNGEKNFAELGDKTLTAFTWTFGIKVAF